MFPYLVKSHKFEHFSMAGMRSALTEVTAQYKPDLDGARVVARVGLNNNGSHRPEQ